MRDPERIPMILQALEREWRKSPDLRLGQFMVNLVARSPYNSGDVQQAMSLMEDGWLLSLLGPETDEEKTYVREEPAKALEGWAEWMKSQRGRRREAKDD